MRLSRGLLAASALFLFATTFVRAQEAPSAARGVSAMQPEQGGVRAPRPMPTGTASPQAVTWIPRATAGGLTINATFDSSITGNANAAAIESMINQSVAIYQALCSDPITVNILFRYTPTWPDGSALGGNTIGGSTYGWYPEAWSTYINALTADAKTSNDSTANGSLPVSALASTVWVSSANGRAIGLNTPAGLSSNGSFNGGPYDGIITLNSALSLQFTRPTNSGSYDAQRTLEHEIDEVLGLGALNAPNGALRPQDLFSWSAPGTRNLSTSGSRYFSINSGTTNIVGFNQTSGGDFGDWLSGSCPQTTPYVQNAFSCTGQNSDVTATSPEGINLDVIGYDLVTGGGNSCGVTGVATVAAKPASVTPPSVAGLPAGGVWKGTPRKNGEAWTYTFDIGEKGPASSGALRSVPATPNAGNASSAFGARTRATDAPVPDVLFQHRFPTEADARRPGEAAPTVRAYEVNFDNDATPELRALSGGKAGWVDVQLDEAQIALIRDHGVPYRRTPAAMPGTAADSTAISGPSGSKPMVARIDAPMDLTGLTLLDARFAHAAPAERLASARIRLTLKHRYVDEVTVRLAVGDRSVVLWDGWGGSDDGSITIDRVLTDDVLGADPAGPWTVSISNADGTNVGRLEELWIAVTTSHETAAAAPGKIGALATLDIVAQRAYLKTAGSNGGTEVSQPTVGQTVYFYVDSAVTDTGSTVTVSLRAVFDGSVFCSGTFDETPGGSYWTVCNSGWTATAGSHTLQWDLDYTNTVAETNESNNSASLSITPSGLDIVAQRAYLKTAASNGGTEVSQPAVGQTVYFYVDSAVTGTGSTVTVNSRAVFDGSVFCSGSFAETPGGSYWTACNSGWEATGGSHSLQWDLDYTNTVAETNENNNSASLSITPASAGIDIAAQRAYMRTAAAGGGTEVGTPAAGQAVYFHGDFQVTGSGTVTVTERAQLDGSTFCSCSTSATAGHSYVASCNQAWSATAGSHTLQWDFDYTNTVAETNESNNSTSVSFTAGTPTVTVAATDANAGEPSNTGQFTITRSGSTASALTVSFTIGGTATNGSDYNTISSPVTIPAGSSSVAITVTPINDTLVEPDETVVLTLASSAAYTVGSPSSATVTITSDDVAPGQRVRFDFDGDSKSDLVWHNAGTGDTWLWLMNSNAITSARYVGNLSSAWTVAAAADFDGDRRTDLIWRNTATGDTWLWLMNGNVVATRYLGNIGSAWTIAAAADFNNDGNADIVLRNASTGDTWLWLMNGNGLISSVYITNMPSAWTIAAAADFNNDGKADLIWRNVSTGDTDRK